MFKRLLYIFLFLLAGVAAFAQQYPVQGSLAIASPYPANLSDYANSNIQSLALNLTLTDLTMANKRVRLKLFIQTQNATIAQSIDNVSGEPLIMLDGGIPQRFTNTELAHYFRLENLQGINPDGYARSLPEGIYTIGFEVYDYFTGSKLSGRIGQTFWMIINDPPLLNTPQDKSKIADFLSPSGGAGGGFSSGGNGGIIFNWTPRSTQVSNTEYEFTLCELWDATGDPYQQFMSAIPKYQTTVSNSTTLIYSLTQPPLVSGYTYAWRVRAKAKAGFEDIGLYRNYGYSNLFTFRYGDPCPAPQSLALEAKTFDEISARWEAPLSTGEGSGVKYKLAYRKYSAAGQWSWAETETSDLFLSIFNLEPATEYEIKVGVSCSPPSGELEGAVFTPSQRATTLAAGQIAGIECGKEPTIDLSQQTLLTLLKAGDVVMANDFPTTITRVAGTSQGWSGEGWTKVPWLGDTRIRVSYAGIKVNSDYKLIEGAFVTTYNPTGKNIVDVDHTIDATKDIVLDITSSADEKSTTDNTDYTVPFIITDSIAALSTFTANSTGGGTISFPNGQTLPIDSVPSTIKDNNGNVYQVDKNGKLSLREELGEPGQEATTNIECGCQEVMLQNVAEGDCKAIVKTLKVIKEAYNTKKKVIISKLALLKGAINIDNQCFPEVIIWIKDKQAKIDPEKYQITESQNSNFFIPDTKLWSITVNDNLQIMIPKSQENSEQKIKELVKWLFGGGETTTASDELYLPDINKYIQWFSQFNSIFEEPCGCWPINDCNGTKIKSNQCCNRAARKIIESAGINTNNLIRQTIAKRSDGNCPKKCDHTKLHELYNDNKVQFEQVITNIDNSLFKNHLPVMVGVQHPYKSKNFHTEWFYKCGSPANNPRYTNHFIVIVGKGKDSKGDFYWFYEVAADDEIEGKSRMNKLWIDKTKSIIKGNTSNVQFNDYYIVTEVRYK